MFFRNSDRTILTQLAAKVEQILAMLGSPQKGETVMLDLSKLQAVDAQLAADVQTLNTTVAAEAVTIQKAIDALSSGTADQATIDAVVANLTTAKGNLEAATAAVGALPTTPTPAP